MVKCSITSATEDSDNSYLTVTGSYSYDSSKAKANGTYDQRPMYAVCVPLGDVSLTDYMELTIVDGSLTLDTNGTEYASFTVNFGSQDGNDTYRGPFIISILSEERRPLDTVILPGNFCETDQTIKFEENHAAYVCNAADFHSLSEAQ